MMEEVTGENGTASAARIKGYRVAGKTGTADRYDDKLERYNGFTASFIGFAPAEAPKYVVAVFIQKPSAGMFGGALAGPVFNQVMSYLLERTGAPPSPKSTLELPRVGRQAPVVGRPEGHQRCAGEAGWPVSWDDVSPTPLRPATSGVLLRDLTARIGAGRPCARAGPDAGDLVVTGVTPRQPRRGPRRRVCRPPGLQRARSPLRRRCRGCRRRRGPHRRRRPDRAGRGARGASRSLVADDPRGVLGEVAAEVYGHPSEGLTMIGITGTNGKTTTAYLVESALRAHGQRTGLIGTVETRIGDERIESVRTTPEATDLHALLGLMRDRGLDACVMEVSSHALDLHRVDGVVYDVALFTNLSQDHLDFHASMDDYFGAKASLFTPQRSRTAVVCVDDAWGRRLAAEATVPTTTLATTTHAQTAATARIARTARTGSSRRPPGRRRRRRCVHAARALDRSGAAARVAPAGPLQRRQHRARRAGAAAHRPRTVRGRGRDVRRPRRAGSHGGRRTRRAGGPALRRRLRPHARRRRRCPRRPPRPRLRAGSSPSSAPAATATAASAPPWAPPQHGRPTSWSSPMTTPAPRTRPRSGRRSSRGHARRSASERRR